MYTVCIRQNSKIVLQVSHDPGVHILVPVIQPNTNVGTAAQDFANVIKDPIQLSEDREITQMG